jgi:hypothetical protein
MDASPATSDQFLDFHNHESVARSQLRPQQSDTVTRLPTLFPEAVRKKSRKSLADGIFALEIDLFVYYDLVEVQKV